MKKNSFLWILVALVVFFFVFGMGKSVYEGFKSCKINKDCPEVSQGGWPHCGICGKTGRCGPGPKKIYGTTCT
jgi:hypothetical protein